MKIELSGDCDPQHYLFVINGFTVRLNDEADYEISEIGRYEATFTPVDDDNEICGEPRVIPYTDVETLYVY